MNVVFYTFLVGYTTSLSDIIPIWRYIRHKCPIYFPLDES